MEDLSSDMKLHQDQQVQWRRDRIFAAMFTNRNSRSGIMRHCKG